MVPGVAGWPFFVAAASSQTVSSDQPTRSDLGVLRAGVGGDEVVELRRLHQVQSDEFAAEADEFAEQLEAPRKR